MNAQVKTPGDLLLISLFRGPRKFINIISEKGMAIYLLFLFY